ERSRPDEVGRSCGRGGAGERQDTAEYRRRQADDACSVHGASACVVRARSRAHQRLEPQRVIGAMRWDGNVRKKIPCAPDTDRAAAEKLSNSCKLPRFSTSRI